MLLVLDHTAAPDAAAVCDFIGFIAVAAATAVNWVGRVRAGTVNSDVDMGVLADTTFRTLGWERVQNGDGSAAGVQFFTLDNSHGNRTFRTNVGAVVLTN